MANDVVVTVRVPEALKRRLEGRARASHRSLSAQVVHELAAAAAADAGPPAPGQFLGLFPSDAVPSDDDILNIRRRWGSRRPRYGSP